MLDLTFRQPAPMTKWAAFRTYWAGYFVSMAGDCFTLLALPIAAYRLTNESWLVGLVDMMEILSGVLLGTLLGVVADRHNPRLVLWASDLIRVGLLAALAVLAWSDDLSAWTLLVLSFGLGAFRALHDGGEAAMLAHIVPADREMQAYARLSVADSTGRIAGPLMAGIATELGLWVAFGIDAATFGLAALVVLLLPRPPDPVRTAADGTAGDAGVSGARAGVRAEFREALDAMRQRPTYLVLVGIGAFGNLAGLTMAGLFVPFAEQVLGMRSIESGFGVLLALMGVGGLAADWHVNRQTTHDPRTAGLSMAVVAASVVLAGAVPSLVTSVIAMITTGAGFAYYQTNYTAFRQEIFPAEILGRVSMATRTIFYLTMIVGLSTGGVIADALGPDRMLMIFGSISLAGILVCGFVKLPVDPVTNKTI